MISPLGQRQIHLTSNMEALRQAHDVAEQQQREAGLKRAADDRLAEARNEVPQISESDALSTEERRNRENGKGHPGAREAAADAEEQEQDEDAGVNFADKHLDFLA